MDIEVLIRVFDRADDRPNMRYGYLHCILKRDDQGVARWSLLGQQWANSFEAAIKFCECLPILERMKVNEPPKRFDSLSAECLEDLTLENYPLELL